MNKKLNYFITYDSNVLHICKTEKKIEGYVICSIFENKLNVVNMWALSRKCECHFKLMGRTN